ncbi:MAG: plasmid partitioning protein RepB [Paracoccaceae bacterium]
MARKGILNPGAAMTAGKRAPAPHRGAVGALQSSLTKMQENAVQDVPADQIDDAGVEDRLGHNSDAHAQLVNSLRTYGQQVPVLLRPHPKTPNRYEIVYGRRRLRALRELGLPVKAMIRQLDDQALVMAQGQENTARQDLSFIEKASFAAQLDTMGYDRPTIADALSMDLPMVSRMLKVGQAFDLDFLRKIGAAPGIGRDRWIAFSTALKAEGALGRAARVANRPEFGALTSDAKFEACFTAAKAPLAKPKPTLSKPRTLRSADGTAIADIRVTGKGVTLNLLSKTGQGFETWMNSNAESVLQDLYDRWQKERSEDTTAVTDRKG